MAFLLKRLRNFRISKSKLYIYGSGAVLTTGFCVSSVALNTTIIAEQAHPHTHLETIEDHFHLLEKLRELAPRIDAAGMLHEFLDSLKMAQTEEGLFDADYVRSLFTGSGIADHQLIEQLIEIMDWNENGKLTKYEVAALFTLFNVGSDVERYKFLFECLDLNQSGTVYKDEFRQILTCLLEAKYHIYGLENARDPDEIYTDIAVDDYHTMAKFNANQLVRKIFIYADQKRKGKLTWTQFLHWCYRGGSEVLTLKELLYQTHDTSAARYS